MEGENVFEPSQAALQGFNEDAAHRRVLVRPDAKFDAVALRQRPEAFLTVLVAFLLVHAQEHVDHARQRLRLHLHVRAVQLH